MVAPRVPVAAILLHICGFPCVVCPGIAATIDRPSIYTHELLPQGPSWKEVQRLIAGTRGDQASLVRDHAVILLLSLYGFRIGEVCSLTLEDVDWAAERIHVRRSKQRKMQDYPLTAEVGEAILRYLDKSGPDPHTASCS